MYRYFIILILSIAVALPSKAQEAADSTAVTQPADSLSRTLDEVVVEAETIKRDGNHDIITITREMRKNSFNTAQMLGEIPGMYFNRSNNTLEYQGRRNIKILMDSVEKDEDFIKKLSHIRFDKVDIIRDPTGRYSEYDLVINLRTRENYEGYEGLTSYYTRINPSYQKGYAFSDSEINPSFIYTKNKWTFTVSPIHMFYRNESNSYTSSQYLLNNLEENSIPNPDGSPSKRTYWRRWSVDVSLDYQFNKNHSLSLRYYVGLVDADNYSRNTLLNGPIDRSAPFDTVGVRNVYRDDGQFHRLGLFYTGRIKGWGIWLGANYVHNPWKVKDRTDRTSGFEVANDMRQQLNQSWVNLDIDRSFLDNKLSVNFGYENNWRKYHAWRLETDASLTSSVDRRHRWYANLSYRITKSTMVRLNGGMTFTNSRSGQIRETQTLYSLGAYISQDFKDGYISLRYDRGVSNPSAQQMRDYGQFTDSLTWSGGNPRLRSVESNYMSTFIYWKNFYLNASCTIIPEQISDIVEPRTGVLPSGAEGSYYAFQPQNTYYRTWGGYLGWDKNIGNCRPGLSIGWKDCYASYKNFSNHENGIDFMARLSYSLDKHNIYALIQYNYNPSPSALPQGYGRGGSDQINLYLSKRWLKGSLYTSLNYILPLHFTDGDIDNWSKTPVLIRHTLSNSQALNYNQITVTVMYQFSGGKSVRRYKRTLYEGN